MATPHFAEYTVETPVLADIQYRYSILLRRIDQAPDFESCLSALEDWDQLFKEVNEWNLLVQVRFYQDTENPKFKEDQDYLDDIWPKYTDLETQIKRKFLESPFLADLEKAKGPQLFALWQKKVSTFDPQIETDLARESKLDSEYTALTAKAQISLNGKDLTLSELGAYFEDPNRETRKLACLGKSRWFYDNGAELDRIYDNQVKVRDGMARTLGYENFVELGYQRMSRIGYGPVEVRAFREEVLREVVPLCQHLAGLQAKKIGVDRLMHWDAEIHLSGGNPRPLGDHDWMIERAREMFAEMGHGLDGFFEELTSRGLMDLKSRKGKGGGGFCEYLPLLAYPFIFANFNGTRSDVDVFTHEMGHAFQVWLGGKRGMSELAWPTTEACEIHSMGLEYLTWPWMDLFYGEQLAETLRKIHLTSSIMFLPYGVSIDLFQHMVYENPKASPQERNAMWQEIEQTFLPWYDYGDLPAEKDGRLWQMKQHIFGAPFYYIDYTLALTGALQLWQKSRTNHGAAMETYTNLCEKGGRLPFSGLLKSAGLKSPFAEGCLKAVIADARAYLL